MNQSFDKDERYPCHVCAGTMIHGVTYTIPREYDPSKPSCGKVYTTPGTHSMASLGPMPPQQLIDCWNCKGSGWVTERRSFRRRNMATRRVNEAPLPELKALSGKTPRTDAQISVHDESDPSVPASAGYWDIVELARQLERELYVAQNEAGRLEETKRQAQETIDDLREKLAAVSTTQHRDEALAFFIAVAFADGYFDDEGDEEIKENVRAWLLTRHIRDDITVQEVVESIIGRTVSARQACDHAWATNGLEPTRCMKCGVPADTTAKP